MQLISFVFQKRKPLLYEHFKEHFTVINGAGGGIFDDEVSSSIFRTHEDLGET